MATNQETLKASIFKFLKTNGYQPTMLDSSGKEMGVSDEADVFQFDFIKDDKNYGPVTIGVDGSGVVTLYYGNNVAKSPKGKTEDGRLSWHQLEVRLRKLTFGLGVRRFDLKDESDLKYDMAKREHTKRLEEGYIPVNRNTTLNDSVPTVKLRIQHTRNLEEGEQRYRNIARIYVENANGERFLLDTKKPGLARVYARHIAEGGQVNDDRWGHINSLVEEYSKMAGFVRATRNNQFNEGVQSLISEGVNHYMSLRETLHKLITKKGYGSYFESWTPTLQEDTIGQPDLAEKFMSSSLDPRIECAMPILAKLNQKISETPMKEISELEEWVNKILEAEDNKEEELDENGLQRYTGIKKYTKKGFEELQKAGREGASEEEKGRIKDKYIHKEGLDKDQKRVGQLGPKAKYAKRGDLVGVAEGTYSKDVERAFPDGKASGVKAGAKAPKGTSTMPKDKEKAKGKPAGAITEMDKSQKGSPGWNISDDEPSGKESYGKSVKAKDVAKDAEKKLNKEMDKAHKKDVKEGQEDLDAILRIVQR